MNARYLPDQFADSGWPSGTSAKKARFVNALIRFIDAGYPESQFTAALYDGLHNHGYFGFIAHYNRHGFYDEKFSTPARQEEFLSELRWACQRDYDSDRTDLWADVKTVLTDHFDQAPPALFTLTPTEQQP